MEKLSHGRNDHIWWKMTRSLSGLSNPSRRAAPNVDALGDFFASKFSLSGDFAALLPTLPCDFPAVPFKNSWRIQLSRVRIMLKILMSIKLLVLTVLVLGSYVTATKSFIALQPCFFVILADLGSFQSHGKLLESHLYFKH